MTASEILETLELFPAGAAVRVESLIKIPAFF
jgi:hypothetical protein